MRTHGHTADTYRELMGLSRSRQLSAPDLSAQIAERQRAAYVTGAPVRASFEAGQRMARTGELTRRRRSAVEPDRPETVELRRRHLAQGRLTVSARRERQLSEFLDARSAPDLATYLRREYADGASLEALAAATGMGRERLTSALDAAGVVRRPTGVNTAHGRRSRARAADAAAAARVSTDDLFGWLAKRRTEGWTLQRLADEVGHSIPWVRARLEAGSAA